MPIEILMPALSPTMTEGNLAKWLKKEGDTISSGDVIAEIETDKATMEVEAVDEGVLAKIIVAQGSENVKVNAVIALLLEDGEDESVLKDYKISEPEVKEEAKKPESAKSEQKQELAPEAAKPAQMMKPAIPNVSFISSSGQNVAASPVAKRVASLNKVDLSAVKGTGPRGRVVKEDVKEFLAGSSGQIRREQTEAVAIKNSNVRKVIANRLLQSKQTVPHFYLSIECNLDNLLGLRSQVNNAAPVDEAGKAIYKISVNDLIIKASALALRDVPGVNASWTDEAIIRYNNVDISVAVAIEDGLITPIVKNAEQKSVISISTEMKSLAKKARENKLQPEEFQGGGFSISNLGMYGIKQFYAIVNPPQGCILAVGSSEKKVIVDEKDNFTSANILSLSLSCDHRVVDGAVGAEFLASLKFYLENPATLLI